MAEDRVVTDPETGSETGPDTAAPERGSALTGRGVRARLARIGTSKQTGNPVLDPLFRTVRANHPKADLALLERAYEVAEKHHRGQVRKSGDPNQIKRQKDSWTFARVMGADDPNWKLVATGE